MKPLTKIVLLATLFCGLALTARPVWATPLFDPSVNTCTTLNCGSVRLDGTVTGERNGVNAVPWVVELYAQPRECVRIAITAESQDLETVVVAPNGAVFRNDDGFVAPCTVCPVVKIGNAPNFGWYTVSVSQFNGAPVETNFTMFYGRYSSGNPNCSSPTPPLSPATAEPSVKPQGGNKEAPDF